MTTFERTRYIIDAKLTMPNPPKALVPRPEIASALDAARAQVVTVVCAPAGYGKTTAVVSWLQPNGVERPADTGQQAAVVAWYSLDEGDDNLFTFVSYLAAAIDRVLPGACSRVMGSLHGAHMPDPDALAALMLADLAQLPAQMILVLDDYHHIRAAEIHQLMARLLRHPPPLLHLVVSTRAAPDLPLARLRAANEVTEIGPAHLAFTRQAVGRLLETIFQRAADAEVVASLYAQTEGWAAGLRLLTLAARLDGDSTRLVLNADRRGQELLFDYLADEVLSHVPEHVFAFLLETSILSTFNAALCGAVCGINDEEDRRNAVALRYLVQHNLFVIEIDEQNGWFRYHPLFQAYLRRQLELLRPPAQIRQLHTRAAGWYGTHGYITESMQAYLAADLPAQAADQLEGALGDLYRGERTQLLQHLAGMLPPALVAERPALLMLQCWLAELRSQWAVMRTCADKAAQVLERCAGATEPTPAQTVWGEIYAARSYYLVSGATLADQQAAAERALMLLPADHIQGRGFALINLARIYRWQGRLSEAEHLLESVLDQQGLRPDALTLRLLNALTLHYMYTLQLDKAERTGEIFLTLAGDGGLKQSLGLAHSLLGGIASLRDQVAAADRHFDANAADLQEVRAAVLLAQIYFYILLVGQQDVGRGMAIAAVLERLERLSQKHGSAEMLRTVEALRTMAALQRGEKRIAVRWASACAMPPVVPGKPLETLIWAQCKLAEGTPAALAHAREALDQVAAVSVNCHDAMFCLEATVLQSVLATAQRRPSESLALLGPAVSLAAEREVPLAFLGHPTVMTNLLRQLAAEPLHGSAASMLLDRLENRGSRAAAQPARERPESNALPRPSVEQLTQREHQIVELLAHRLSNEEIAASLMISPHTVRNHLANLYGKLGVTSRRAAVAEARRMGLLPEGAAPNGYESSTFLLKTT